MALNAKQIEVVEGELRKIAVDLDLTDLQKQRFHDFLSDAAERLEKYKQQNPNPSAADLVNAVANNRNAIRQRMAFFLTTDQLSKWDGEAQKAKEFLGLKTVA